MKRQTFKYPGDAAFQRLLEKYNCPTPFHVVRMRFRSKVLTQIHAIVDARLFSGRPWPADREACDSGAHQSLRASWNAISVSGGVIDQAGLRRGSRTPKNGGLEPIQFTPVHILLRRNSFGIPWG